MRAALLAATVLCGLSTGGHAASITVSQILSGTPTYGGVFLDYRLPAFDTTLGTLTSSYVDLSGSLNPGSIIFSKYPQDVFPQSLILSPFASLRVGQAIFNAVIPTQVSAVGVVDANRDFVSSIPVSFTIHADSPISPSFVSDPDFQFGAFTALSVPAGDPGFFVRTEGADSTTTFARLSLTYIYTPIPEPASFALLGLGIVGLAAARRKSIAG